MEQAHIGWNFAQKLISVPRRLLDTLEYKLIHCKMIGIMLSKSIIVNCTIQTWAFFNLLPQVECRTRNFELIGTLITSTLGTLC